MDYVLKSSIHTVIGETIIADIRSQRSAYYFFVGGLDLSNGTGSTSADDTYAYELGVRDQIIGLKKIQDSDVSFVIPRIDWTTGIVYDQYDDYSPTYPAASGATSIDAAMFYVVTDEFKVYKCLYNNNGAASTVKPTSTLATPFYSSDGYRWKFMYLIPLSARNRFMNSAFIPVQTALLDNFYSAGQILTTALLNMGTGYTTASILIDGDGQGAILTPVISGGQIIQVIVTNPGTGYTYANLTVSGDGTGANIVATLSVGDLDTSQADVELLATRGTIEAYRITNGGAGYAATGVPNTGLADGVSTLFQLTDGGATVVPFQGMETIYLTNWQGTQKLYTSQRTNLHPYSDTIGDAHYSLSRVAVTQDATTGRDGSMSMSKILINSAGTAYAGLLTGSRLPVLAATDYTFSVDVKYGNAAQLAIRIYDVTIATLIGTVILNMNSGSLPTVSSKTAGLTVTIGAGTNSAYRVGVTFNTGTYTAVTCLMYPDNSSTLNNYSYFDKAQLEVGDFSTSYIPAVATSASKTDILSLTADGRVSLNFVPLSTDVLTWVGSYKNLSGNTQTVTNSPVVPVSAIVLPSVAIDGDGTGAAGYPVISNGQIVGIIVSNPGQNYTNARVIINGNGQGATAVPIYAPPGGHGKNAINEFKSTRLSFFSNLLNDKNQGLAVSNRFTTIGLLRNPSEYGSDRFYSGALASACNLITFSGPAPSKNDLLSDITTGNRFQVIQVSGTSLLLQNLDNYDLPSNSSLLNNNSGGQIVALTVTDPSIDKFSGDLMFIDNFSINQQAGQQIIIFKTTLKF